MIRIWGIYTKKRQTNALDIGFFKYLSTISAAEISILGELAKAPF